MERIPRRGGRWQRAGAAPGLQLRPLAIMLDAVMPGMDGWAVRTAPKVAPNLADSPVVLLAMVYNRNKEFRLGASDSVIKPVEPERLAAVPR